MKYFHSAKSLSVNNLKSQYHASFKCLNLHITCKENFRYEALSKKPVKTRINNTHELLPATMNNSGIQHLLLHLMLNKMNKHLI